MSQSFARPLSLGNVMSAGITLYRSHLKSYLGISIKAHLWGLIPVYGWAKFEALKAAIARHSYQELTHKPESLKITQDTLRPKLWGFWVIQLLINMILFGVQTVFNVGVQLLAVPMGTIFSDVDPVFRLTLFLLLSLIPLTMVLLFVMAYLWIVSRFFIPELPYAIEENLDLVKAIERSWNLTGGKPVWQIMLIICVIAVIITPLYIMAAIPPLFILFPAIALVSDPSVGTAGAVSFAVTLFFVVMLWVVLYLFVSACTLPLWQSLKAVIYYDIRVRKEGLGLTLRDRTN